MIPTPSQMQDRSPNCWKAQPAIPAINRAIGEVEQLPTHFNVRCNWRAHPRGRKRDLDAI